MRVLLVFFAFTLIGSPAWATRCRGYFPELPGFDAQISTTIDYHSLIMDAVIVRPAAKWDDIAEVRPVRVYKGPKRGRYRIGNDPASAIVVDDALRLGAPKFKAGQRIFLILAGGPEYYHASSCSNPVDPRVRHAIIKVLAGTGISR